MQAGDDDGAFGHEGRTDAGRPKQVGRKDDGVITAARPKQVFEQPGRAEQEAHPAHLVVEVRDLPLLYGKLCPQRRPARMADDGEAPHREPIFFGRAFGQLVGPRVMVEGTGGDDVDVMTAGREPERSLPGNRLRPSEHSRPEPGRDERQPHVQRLRELRGRDAGNAPWLLITPSVVAAPIPPATSGRRPEAAWPAKCAPQVE